MSPQIEKQQQHKQAGSKRRKAMPKSNRSRSVRNSDFQSTFDEEVYNYTYYRKQCLESDPFNGNAVGCLEDTELATASTPSSRNLSAFWPSVFHRHVDHIRCDETEGSDDTATSPPTEHVSLEKSVMKIQAKYTPTLLRREVAGSEDVMEDISLPGHCRLIPSLVNSGRKTLLLRSSRNAVALVVMPPSGPSTFLPVTGCSKRHLKFAETEIFGDKLLATASGLWTVCQAWDDMPVKRSQHRDPLSQALSGASVYYKGNPTTCDWLESKRSILLGMVGNPVGEDADENCTQRCPICLESIDTNTTKESVVRLQGCGHTFCLDCGQRYVRTNALSQLPCPASRCSTVSSLTDIAQILAMPTNSAATIRPSPILNKILSKELENYSLGDLKGRHCPFPWCGKVLGAADIDSDVFGWNLLHCSCGVTTICGSCHRRAHPGVSCAEYGELRESIDSGKADSENDSLRYLLECSRPCPRCGFAIEKNGGCNHMRCTKCDFYFCFQCGGPGNDCMAFYCQKERKYWHEDNPDAPRMFADLRKHLELYRTFRQFERRLQRLDQSIQRDALPATRAMSLERQLTLAVLWVRGYLLIRRLTSNDEATRCVNELEIAMEALRFRENDLTLTNRQVHSSVQSILGSGNDEFVRLMAIQKLKHYCSIDDKQFDLSATLAMENAVKMLPKASDTHKRSRRKKTTSTMMSQPASCLNRRKPRQNDPWRNGLRKVAAHEQAIRWKGKLKNQRMDLR